MFIGDTVAQLHLTQLMFCKAVLHVAEQLSLVLYAKSVQNAWVLRCSQEGCEGAHQQQPA